MDVWPLVQRGAIQSIQELSRRTQFNVVIYDGGQPDSCFRRPKRATRTAKSQAIKWLVAVKPSVIYMVNGGCVNAAIDTAFGTLRQTRPRRGISKRVIVVGMETPPRCAGNPISVQSITDLNTRLIPIDTVYVQSDNFFQNGAGDWWQHLALSNAGTYRFVED